MGVFVLCNVRSHAVLTTARDELLGVVAPIGAQRDAAITGYRSVEHGDRRIAFSLSARFRDVEVGAEGTVFRASPPPLTGSFFAGEYGGDVGVYEVMATRSA